MGDELIHSMHLLCGIHYRIFTGQVEINVHDDVVRSFNVTDSERAHGVHGVMTVFGSGRTDKIK